MKLTFVLAAVCMAFLPASFVKATNYINNGTFAAYNLNSGDTLRIAQGTFNGVVTNLPSGAVIIVAPNATFTPTVINFWAPAGKIINHGTCLFKAMGIGAGFSMANYGNATVDGDMSFYSGSLKSLENFPGSSLTINGSLALGGNTTIINRGFITTGGSLSIQSSSASLTNTGVIVVSASFSNQGQLVNENTIEINGAFNYWGGTTINTGEISPMGDVSISAGLTYTNSCRMITKGGLNNYGTLQNNGLIWAGTNNTAADQFTNTGTTIMGTGSKLRTATLTNYGTIRGKGHLYATGQTTLGSGAVVGVTGVTTDTLYIFDVTRSNPSRVFDNQWGTVRPNAVYRPFAQPDTLEMPAGCSDAFRTGGALPVKWNYFYVKMVQQTPVLTWSAEYEAGMQFEIERSYDNSSFTTISSVTSNNTANYTYTDAGADGSRAYIAYRIKGTSMINGSVKYTEVRLIKNREDQTASIAIYPNPTKDKAVISYRSNGHEQVILSIRSSGGQQIASKNVAVTAGVNRFELNEVKNLKPGTYFIDVLNKNGVVITESLVKQ